MSPYTVLGALLADTPVPVTVLRRLWDFDSNAVAMEVGEQQEDWRLAGQGVCVGGGG